MGSFNVKKNPRAGKRDIKREWESGKERERESERER
jgi:hypothetical protein